MGIRYLLDENNTPEKIVRKPTSEGYIRARNTTAIVSIGTASFGTALEILPTTIEPLESNLIKPLEYASFISTLYLLTLAIVAHKKSKLEKKRQGLENSFLK